MSLDFDLENVSQFNQGWQFWQKEHFNYKWSNNPVVFLSDSLPDVLVSKRKEVYQITDAMKIITDWSAETPVDNLKIKQIFSI